MVRWHITLIINTIFIVYDVKDDEFFMSAKFWFSAIIYAEVIANNSFSTAKPLSPRP